MPITPLEYLGLALLGLAAGTLGGLLGVGGSLLAVPVLVLFFPFAGRPIDIHLAICAAMLMNASVGGMASYRHWRVGTMQPGVIRWLVPAAVAGVIAGVLWGNTFVDDASKSILRRTFGVFALYVAAYNLRQFWRGFRAARQEPAAENIEAKPEGADDADDAIILAEGLRPEFRADAIKPGASPRSITPAAPPSPLGNEEARLPVEQMSFAIGQTLPSPLLMVLVGMPAGLLAGLLGIGGGGVTVPFQQLVLRLPLKNAIGNSALVVFAASSVGSALKLATVGPLLPPEHGLTAPLWLAAGLVPAAMLGAYWGSYLTRVLPAHWVVAPFVVLMLVMGSQMVILG